MNYENESYDFERFLRAQESLFDDACRELNAGEKKGHWMWFIFPQLRGLGISAKSFEFGIASLSEAHAYLNHRILGPRLQKITGIVLSVERRSALKIFGFPDNLKFCSSMTLFSYVSIGNNVFADAVNKYFAGQYDQRTTDILKEREKSHKDETTKNSAHRR